MPIDEEDIVKFNSPQWGLNLFGARGIEAVIKELIQIEIIQKLMPLDVSMLLEDKKAEALETQCLQKRREWGDLVMHLYKWDKTT